MKTTHFERISTKPVTIQQEVHEVVDVPTIDCTTRLRVEVTSYPSGQVLLNGVLLAGAQLQSHETNSSGLFGQSRTNVNIILPYGRVLLEDVVLIINETAIPREAEWKKKPAEMIRPGVHIDYNQPYLCVAPSCPSVHLRSAPDGMWRCQRHYEEKYGPVCTYCRKPLANCPHGMR